VTPGSAGLVALREDEVAAFDGIPLVKTKAARVFDRPRVRRDVGASSARTTPRSTRQFQFGFSIFILAM